ncbi:hypothetical protein [Tessaracoccus palaemonis]|uniref:CopC domain-containing protein n=1 Tax=Tessaracoccus palaemonis TaxID=2829499 RepID=A0ABX8SPN4_9ACTN|nr:hypothetical protein [Tessaracoccus palaemonis]QXT64158.1 hypothetical protein KDB89_06845 [Tessaracoccus palaemonis]
MSRIRTLAAAVLAAAFSLSAVTVAVALPPDGAGANTEGTSSSVSSTVEPGGTISFTVSGFPAGETLSVKVDDGVGYDQTTVQGGGVVYQQKIPASGTVNGSFPLPSFVAEGSHWLRFLASEEFTDSKGNTGVKGYTNKSPSFTVAAAAQSVTETTSAPTSASTTAATATAQTTAGTVATAAPTAAASVAASPAAKVAGASGAVITVQPSAAPSASATAAAESQPAPSATHLAADATAAPATTPVAGLVALTGAILIAVVGSWLALRRPRNAGSR